MIIHEFRVGPEARPEIFIEIMELTHPQCQRIAEQAAQKFSMNIIAGTAHEAELRRLQCVRGLRRYSYEPDTTQDSGERQECTLDLHVRRGEGEGPHDILAAMTEREAGFLQLGIDNTHEVRAEETAGFFGSRKTTEV